MLLERISHGVASTAAVRARHRRFDTELVSLVLLPHVSDMAQPTSWPVVDIVRVRACVWGVDVASDAERTRQHGQPARPSVSEMNRMSSASSASGTKSTSHLLLPRNKRRSLLVHNKRRKSEFSYPSNTITTTIIIIVVIIVVIIVIIVVVVVVVVVVVSFHKEMEKFWKFC
jgi:hypothetical protein